MKAIVVFTILVFFAAGQCLARNNRFISFNEFSLLPSLDVPACPSEANTTNTPFTLASGTGLAIQQTFVYACHVPSGLNFVIYAQDNNIQTTYKDQCNVAVWGGSTVELFISPGNIIPHKYFELDVNPYNAVYFASVDNPNLTCTGITDNALACEQTGIIHSATVMSNGYQVEMFVPYSLITQAKQYRANFFRIDTPAGGVKEYSAWSSPQSSPPCFHKPGMFGTLNLV